jgi:lipopolysaccharide biosynthesis regulator YciM
MHGGCTGALESGKEAVDKVRMMGFAAQPMPMPLQITCENCSEPFEMTTFEFSCPKCEMVYAVTPCHAFDPGNVKAAGIKY